ncbi:MULTISPECIES: hypothetical protein [Mycolicibacterium]|jgi:hypothetical protein|nr:MULTISPECIES: hypothetical protein [Mycolicibacterium]QFS89111.1 hypothetical protein FIV07_00050 [Mycobacterium sp. THAF192]|tara:strand:- start:49 stop:171 length:123 start_codon:yes stop_codon:yes gene_type:complete
MKLVFLLAAGVAVAAAVVWRTQHEPEVWHTLPGRLADVPS